VTQDDSQCQCWGPVGAGQFWDKTKEILNISRQHRKIGSAKKLEEKQHRKKRKRSTEKGGKAVPRKADRKWKNYYGEVGKWTSVNLENDWIMDQRRLSQGESGQT
jgi:hypothetical protein